MQWVWFLLPTVLTLKNVKVHARQPNLHTSFLNYSRLYREQHSPRGEKRHLPCVHSGVISSKKYWVASKAESGSS